MLSKSWLIIRWAENNFSRFLSIFWCYLKVGSLFVSENSDPKIIFRFFSSIFCYFFWCYLKVGSLFGSNNSEPKIIVLYFFLGFCHFFWCQKFKNLQTILTRKINFLIIFSRFFLSFFKGIPKVGSLFVSDNSDLKIIFRFFFSIFCHVFWYNLKVGSLFVSENSDPKIISRFFCQFFGII